MNKRITKGKLSKLGISEEYVQLVALHVSVPMNFHKGVGDPWCMVSPTPRKTYVHHTPCLVGGSIICVYQKCKMICRCIF